MSILSDLLAKAPQSVKNKYKMKIRDKAIEKVKEKIIKHNKTIDDYSDGEMEEMIAAEEGNLNEDVKKTVLTNKVISVTNTSKIQSDSSVVDDENGLITYTGNVKVKIKNK